MDPFRSTAFRLALRFAILAALGAVLLIALNGVEPAAAFLIAANIALLFALALMAGVAHLTRQMTRAPFWSALPPGLRPAGESGLRMARAALHDTWLGFAKGSAAVAIVFSGFAYASSGVSGSDFARAARKPPAAQTQTGKFAWSAYRPDRVLPTN